MRCCNITQDYLSTFPNFEKEFEMAADSIKELQEYACRIVRRGVKTPPPLLGKQPPPPILGNPPFLKIAETHPHP